MHLHAVCCMQVLATETIMKYAEMIASELTKD